jgi:hypothetical protein
MHLAITGEESCTITIGPRQPGQFWACITETEFFISNNKILYEDLKFVIRQFLYILKILIGVKNRKD